jgi:pyruvate kinase
MIRELEKECGRRIPIMQDLPGPRIQEGAEHTYDPKALTLLTDEDKKSIEFGVAQKLDYIALSFVGGPADVVAAKKVVFEYLGTQKIIAKIERKVAVDLIDEIIAVSDVIMIARGDLGNEVPLEQIPFIQAEIIKRCKKAGKPVITATQMMLSMVENPTPTRAEVTDVENAIMSGSDAVMLSEETAKGKYPVETVAMMDRIILETERHEGVEVRGL